MFSIFYHVSILKHWQKSDAIIQQYLNDSGILKDCDNIFYCVNGDISKTNFTNGTVLHLSNDSTVAYEFPTLNFMHGYLHHNTTKALYIHTKGASSYDPKNENRILYWLDTMCYYNIGKYKKALDLLETYDAVGSGHTPGYWPQAHFSGNFFWTKSEHVRKLKPLIIGNNFNSTDGWRVRHDAEKWIGSFKGNFCNLGNDYNESKYKQPPSKKV